MAFPLISRRARHRPETQPAEEVHRKAVVSFGFAELFPEPGYCRGKHMDYNDCVHDLSESAGTDAVVRHWDIDAVCIHEISMRRQLGSARHGFQRVRARGVGILTRFVSLKLVRSRCGDSSTPQDTDFNECVHEELGY